MVRSLQESGLWGEAGFSACGEKAWPAERLRKTYLDAKLYKARIRCGVVTFLAFAGKHGAASGNAHVRVKGLGLGVSGRSTVCKNI